MLYLLLYSTSYSTMILNRYNVLTVSILSLFLSCGEKATLDNKEPGESHTAKKMTEPESSSSVPPIMRQDLNKSFLPLQKKRILAEPLMPLVESQTNAYDHE